jgi:deoxyribodipyrimidine photo-lyase
MDTAVVVFTRDLRLHDNPALSLACARARRVVPVFVADPALPAPPNRLRFLTQSLAGLRDALRERGGDLVIRHGEPVKEIIRLAGQTHAEGIYIADDVSGYAARRRGGLERECARHRLDLVCTPGVTVVPPGDLRPSSGGDHYRVFTPYWRAWAASSWRQPCPAPRAITMPEAGGCGDIPAGTGFSPGLAAGGEAAGQRRVRAWLDGRLAGYAGAHDDLAGDGTSRLSPYLRFGCVSPLELARAALACPGGQEFCRQLAWRDFFHQVAAAFHDIARADCRPGPQTWRTDQDALDAWRAGLTGIPVVDAGMRQLAAEGFMHNRARMITASFLTRTLGIHWRHGYGHFGGLLADGDVACNAGNWQWVAGTGNNTRPGRVLNPLRQARRFDPDGSYVRRYVPELAGLDAASIHTPWTLPTTARRQLRGSVRRLAAP